MGVSAQETLFQDLTPNWGNSKAGKTKGEGSGAPDACKPLWEARNSIVNIAETIAFGESKPQKDDSYTVLSKNKPRTSFLQLNQTQGTIFGPPKTLKRRRG